MSEEESNVVGLNVSLLKATHERLLQIHAQFHSANLSLTVQRLIEGFRLEVGRTEVK